jgi:nucleoside 2-deoxyribosyltransferase
MSKRIYIAGKWSDKENIRKCMDEVEQLGFSISHDWCTYESNATNTKSDMAQKDVEGVLSADIVVLLLTDPTYAYRGTWSELGVCLGQSSTKKIYIVCPQENSQCRTNVFFHHPAIIHLKTWEEVIQELINQKQLTQITQDK